MHASSHPRHQYVTDRQAQYQAQATRFRLGRLARRPVPHDPPPRPTPSRAPLRLVPDRPSTPSAPAQPSAA